jgi:hypothetical protein
VDLSPREKDKLLADAGDTCGEAATDTGAGTGGDGGPTATAGGQPALSSLTGVFSEKRASPFWG